MEAGIAYQQAACLPRVDYRSFGVGAATSRADPGTIGDWHKYLYGSGPFFLRAALALVLELPLV